MTPIVVTMDEPQPSTNPPTAPTHCSHGASSLARGPGSEAHSNFRFTDVAMPIPVLDDFLNTLKYPLFVRDPNFVIQITGLETRMIEQIAYRYKTHLPFRHWAQLLENDALESNDPYEIQKWGFTLFSSWYSTSSALALDGNEAEICRGVDNMIQLAFQTRSGANHIVRVERDLPLPGSPGKATADLVALMKLPLDWSHFLSCLENQHVFNSGFPGNIITFVYEAKCHDRAAASHQLSFYLCSAQHQHKALGFDDGHIFGAALIGGVLQIYGSWWAQDTVMIYPTKYSFPLTTFADFLSCYIFLCKLANHVANEVNGVFQDWEDDEQKYILQKKAHHASGNPWYDEKSQASRSSRKHSHSEVDGGTQDGDDLESSMMEDGESFGQGPRDAPMVFDAMSQSQGDLLTHTNLQALAHTESGMVPVPPAKDIQGWAQQLAGANVDTNVL